MRYKKLEIWHLARELVSAHPETDAWVVILSPSFHWG